MYPKLGLTRNVLRRRYALITPDGHVPSVLPGWSRCTAYVILSRAMGANITQLLVDLEAGGAGQAEPSDDEWFFYVVAGAGVCNGITLATGDYAFVPAGEKFTFSGTQDATRLLIFRKVYQALRESAKPTFFAGRAQDAPAAPFLGDPRARLQTLLPDSPAMDLAVNIFTYDPGATLPFVETHVMEHGMFFLDGGGVYRLDEAWHPVRAGDSLWIAPYCPQWFIAAGPPSARYIYYKDVNRLP